VISFQIHNIIGEIYQQSNCGDEITFAVAHLKYPSKLLKNNYNDRPLVVNIIDINITSTLSNKEETSTPTSSTKNI